MTGLRHSGTVLRGGARPGDPEVALGYDARLIRRKRLTTPVGDVLVDLPEATSLEAGDALDLGDGTRLAIAAAPETLIEARGDDLVRIAWHVGNRHAPCEITGDALRLREDPVLERMLQHLGADLRRVQAPFRPEGGAYGHGRTFGHDHGEGPHDHGQSHAHHDHAHDDGRHG